MKVTDLPSHQRGQFSPAELEQVLFWINLIGVHEWKYEMTVKEQGVDMGVVHLSSVF